MEKNPFTVTVEWRIENFASWTHVEDASKPIVSSRTAGVPDISVVVYPQGRCSDMECRLYGDLGLYDTELSFFGNDGSLIHTQEWEGNSEDDFYQLFFGPEFKSLVAHVRKHEALYGDHITVRMRFRAPGEERHDCLLTVVKDSWEWKDSSYLVPPSPKKLKMNDDEPNQAACASSSKPQQQGIDNSTTDGFLLRMEVCGNLCVGITPEDFFASYQFARCCFGRRPTVTVDALERVLRELNKPIGVNFLLEEYVEFITKFGTICADGFSLVGPFVRGETDQIDYLVSVQRAFEERLRKKSKIRKADIKYCWLIAQVVHEEVNGHKYFYTNSSLLGQGHIFTMEHSGKCNLLTHSFTEFLEKTCRAHEYRMMERIFKKPDTKKRRVISSLDGLGESVECGRFRIESLDVPYSERP